MKTLDRHTNIYAGLLIFLMIIGNCTALNQNSDISFIGQVTWQEIEGGFYGIVTPDGTAYLPMNLPDRYQVDGVTVKIIGTIPSDVMTLHMWGEPVEILSINPVNRENPYTQPWYAPDTNPPYYENNIQAEYLVMAASALQTNLETIDEKLREIAQNLTESGTQPENIKDNLHKGLDIPGLYEVIWMDNTGKLVMIVPEDFEAYEGEDVSKQDLNSRILAYPIPGMSEYFTTIEGKDAIILAYPVFTSDMEVAGYITALFDPVNLIEKSALPSLNGTNYELMVAQPNGKILYDRHSDMNGQETWNNSIFDDFPDLLHWATHYQNAKAGIDQYSYYRENSEEIVKTDVIWTTVSLHGTPWRVFILSR
jgi:hypothetical protein